MIVKIADNIVSPLGTTTAGNYEAIVGGHAMLKPYDGRFGLPEPFCGSLLDREAIDSLCATEIGDVERYTFFERLCILSATKALAECGIDASGDDVVFVLSTTKGNVDLLETDLTDERCCLGASAHRIGEHFGNHNATLVVSNACISGVCAQITAIRALLSGAYKYAVVIGCDVLSRFIVSGFQSFKALSGSPCRPFDKLRCGLNLGEAAGTIVLKAQGDQAGGGWTFAACSNHNDANHISGPSRTGEGTYRVLTDLLRGVDIEDVAFINVHGTATAYNDEMEAVAIQRCGLERVPVSALKGYFGHTLGAAGIIETILSMKAIDNHTIPATMGYNENGVSCRLNISNETRPTDKVAFFKILSGFGGSNAGIAFKKGGGQ